MKYPSSPEVGVGALVLAGDRVLLVKRRNEPGAGKWSVPGGHLKLGERVCEAAVRELREETGLSGRPLGVVWVDELIERDAAGKVRYHYVLLDVLVEPKNPPENARPRSDAEDVAIVSLEEALNMNLTSSAKRLIRYIAASQSALDKIVYSRC